METALISTRHMNKPVLASPIALLSVVLAALAIHAPRAGAAGFDCKTAASPVETAVCADKELSTLDEYLARYYAAARAALGDGGDCLSADQLVWLREVRDACGPDRACLDTAYRRRLATLHALQPGATRLREINLPRTETLVTAIPPEADASHDTAAEPLEVRGRLVHAGADPEHMGLAIEGRDGLPHVIVFDMDIGNSPTHEALLYRIEHDAGAAFLVRGTNDGKGNFAPGRCRLVYRLGE